MLDPFYKIHQNTQDLCVTKKALKEKENLMKKIQNKFKKIKEIINKLITLTLESEYLITETDGSSHECKGILLSKNNRYDPKSTFFL